MRYAPEMRKLREKYRTTYNQRETINYYSKHDVTEETYKFAYMPNYSNDDVAVYYSTKRDAYIVAFRGTDFDPFRYLGYLPDHYKEVLKDAQNENKKNLPAHRFEPDYDCDSTKKEGEFFNDIRQASQSYCDFSDINLGLGKHRWSTNCSENKAKFYDEHYLRGGTAEKCLPISDCAANKFITRTTISFNADLDLKNEPKHERAAETLLNLYLKKRCRRIIITGHSLGGSLALNSFVNLLYNPEFVRDATDHKINIRVIIFNSAPTAATVSVPRTWIPYVLHVRNKNDVVSHGRFRDKDIETWNYENYSGQETHFIGEATRQIHGLSQFLCRDLFKEPSVKRVKIDNKENNFRGMNLDYV